VSDFESPEGNQTDSGQPKKGSGVVHFLLEALETLAIAAVLYFAIDFVVARVRVENISMLPTLQPGEFVLVNKMAYQMGDFHRGDIVVFHYSPQEDYIKRIIGLPGDMVEIGSGQVTVNGQIVEEPYISAAPQYAGAWQVPADSLFVLGDNRNQSSDSHRWGFISEQSVVGEALVVYWPVTEIKILTQPWVVKASN
jgi:signal peptidase I